MRHLPRLRFLAALAVAVVVVAGCSSADDPETSASDTEESTDSTGSDDAGTEDIGSKPAVEVDGDAPPPEELQIEDIVVGEGAEAGATDTVVVNYVGVGWSSGEEFDSSWDRGEPATFPLTGVVPGFQQGITGMKEGGSRRITMPPELAYGDNPPPGSGIAAGETLVFVVDLVEVL